MAHCGLSHPLSGDGQTVARRIAIKIHRSASLEPLQPAWSRYDDGGALRMPDRPGSARLRTKRDAALTSAVTPEADQPQMSPPDLFSMLTMYIQKDPGTARWSASVLP
jgi:hypothetical protein